MITREYAGAGTDLPDHHTTFPSPVCGLANTSSKRRRTHISVACITFGGRFSDDELILWDTRGSDFEQ
jgi:hypothetical protein